MKLTPIKPALMALCTVFALSGCEQLRVESIPTGEVVACDNALTGWWTGSTEDSDQEIFVHVSDDCSTWLSVEKNDDGSMKLENLGEEMKFQTLEINATRILAVSPTTPDDDKYILDGHLLFRYEVNPSVLKLFAGSSRIEARRIAEGKVAGRVEARRVGDCGNRAPCEVNALITGSPDDIRGWLISFKPLNQKYATFKRVPTDASVDLEALLKSAPSDGKPKPHE